MSEHQGKGLYSASFRYSDGILGDFEAMYLDKKDTPMPVRIALGALGALGAVYFGFMIYREGLQFTRIGYLMICSLMMLVAFSRGGKRADDTIRKYRKYYLDKTATFRIDDAGVEMHLEGQKNYARSKFKEIYGLFDTDLCWYFVIRGKAYYILPKDSVCGDGPDEFKRFMEKKCAKRFLHYDTGKA